jgi:hypothetical protein
MCEWKTTARAREEHQQISGGEICDEGCLMKTYTVKWTIEIDAATPEEAAWKALEIHRGPASLATAFDIYDQDGNHTYVDLLE